MYIYHFNIFKCNQVHSHCCANITTIHLQYIFHLAQLKLCPYLTITPYDPYPKSLTNTDLLYLYELDYFRNLT